MSGSWLCRAQGTPSCSLVGRTITIDGEPHAVVGLMPRRSGFQFGSGRTGRFE
jgi:hypothetical protein